ncbi:hypothetical protein K474DRAFT_447975 [Panus rudis PR-1116 ss-1]|nr:hypothetical protein K474DRAFT_447975 [Panus rudis PR-1116 ss-1]
MNMSDPPSVEATIVVSPEQPQVAAEVNDTPTLRCRRNSLVPAINRCLPDELLAAIFEIAVTVPVTHSDPRDEEGIIPISHVCSRWRSVALANGPCWRILNMNRPDEAAAFAERSKNSDLRLYLTESGRTHNLPLPTALVSSVRDHASQVTTIDLFSVKSGLQEHVVLFDGALLPRLQRLRLANEWQHSFRVETSMINQGHLCPKLHTVDLFNVEMNWESHIFSNLINLSLYVQGMPPRPTIPFALDQLLNILNRCPRMERLSLSGLDLREGAQRAPKVPLTHLESIYVGDGELIRIKEIFTSIVMPSSSRVSFNVWAAEWDGREFFSEDVLASLSQLRELNTIIVTVQGSFTLRIDGFSGARPRWLTSLGDSDDEDETERDYEPHDSHVQFQISSPTFTNRANHPYTVALAPLTNLFHQTSSVRSLAFGADFRVTPENTPDSTQAWTSVLRELPLLELLYVQGMTNDIALTEVVRDLSASLQNDNVHCLSLSRLTFEAFVVNDNMDMPNTFRDLVDGLLGREVHLQEVTLRLCFWPKEEHRRDAIKSSLKDVLYPTHLSVVGFADVESF